MATKFASGKHAIALCDRCGFKYKLTKLKKLVIKTKDVNILVCPTCWEEDHPQLKLGMFPVYDPQALRNPRPENFTLSRGTQYGWSPVGINNPLGLDLPNALTAQGSMGQFQIN